MQFFQLDVFAEAAYEGNPLAVFPDAGELKAAQMQAIAREMNLSETTFVTNVDRDGYDVRIFTPQAELPFAGHPTIGTAWLLKHIDAVDGDSLVQRSAAGETQLHLRDGMWWFERSGEAGPNLHETDPTVVTKLAKALGLTDRDIGFDALAVGRSGVLMPAYSNAGLEQLMVPVTDVETLGRCAPRADLLTEIASGAFCIAPDRPGFIRARGFWPGFGVAEDPATGSACAALGAYLADRLGAIDVRVNQGVEMGRSSLMHLQADGSKVSLGGACELIFEGKLGALP